MYGKFQRETNKKNISVLNKKPPTFNGGLIF